MSSKRISLVGKDEETERYLGRRLKEYQLETRRSLDDIDADDPPALIVFEPEGEIADADAAKLRALGVPFQIVSQVETMKSAVKAMAAGAVDYFLRSQDREDVAEAIYGILEPPKASLPPPIGDDETELEDFMIGHSPKIQEVFKLIGKIAESNVSVLLRGDSGTGKELVAHQIHRNSPRKSHPFICIDCAAIPRELVENELFGHEQGAYSGAESRATGKFDIGNHGTVFLDEISEMDLDLQSKILRVIQESEFYRVGGTQPVRIDVRIIVATQADLEALVRSGGFRADLYHRLNVIALYLPPLAERREDISILAHYFVRKHCRILGIPPKDLGADFVRSLQRYDWPGNVRELENVVRRGLLLERGPVVTGRFLELSPSGADGPFDEEGQRFAKLVAGRFLASEINWKKNDVYKQATHKVEKLLVKLVLKHTRGNQVLASRVLGISRNTLRVKMQELDLESAAFK